MVKRFLFIMLFLSQYVSSQDLIHYSTDDGLPHDLTYNIYLDPEGYMWLGTDDGLVKFNGKEFTTYSESDGLSNTYAIDIQPYAKDTLAIATWGGGLFFFTNGTFSRVVEDDFAKINEIRVQDGFIYGNLTKYEKKDGAWNRKYIIIDSLQVNVVSEQFIHGSAFPQLNWVGDRLLAHGQLIKGRKRQNFVGVYQYKDDSIRLVFPFLRKKTIHAILPLNEDFYLASEFDRLHIFNEESLLETIDMNLMDRVIVKMTKFSDNEFFFLASDANGFKKPYRYNLATKELMDITAQYDINSTVSDIKIDFEKNIWLTTYGEGIYQIPYRSFKVNTVFDAQDVTKIMSYNGKIYGLRAGNLFEFENQKLTKNYKLKGFAKNMYVKNGKIEVFSLITDDDDIQVNSFITEKRGTFGHFDDHYEIVSRDSLMIFGKAYENRMSKNMNQIIRTKEGRYLVGTNLGLFYLNETDFSFTETPYDALKGVSVMDIEQQREIYWFGTSQGLFKLDDQGMTKISIGDGLLSDNIKDILVGSDQRLWIATTKGLSVYDGQSFVNITKNENLLSNNINSVFEDRNQNIWIATVKGVSLLTRENQNFKQIPPIINIAQNEIGFNYDVISYSSSKNLFTQYQINDQPWKVSTSSTLDFKNFKEGEYSFRLRSKKPNSDWQYSDIYTFHIRIPLYEKTGFLAFIVGFIGLMIISLIYYQLKKSNKTNRLLTRSIQKQNELEAKLTTVRENIAEDFHDDLGNKLASITILTDLLSHKVSSKESKGIVNQILNHSDSLYKGTKDFIWTLKKESDQIEEMVTYLSDFGEDFFQPLNIQFRIEKQIEQNIKLPYYWNRHLILIFKEAMTNAAKHSCCTETIIVFSFSKGLLRISFKDNGTGFSDRDHSHENGLKNMEDRAKKIGGEFHIHTSQKGTEVVFSGNVYPKKVGQEHTLNSKFTR